MGKIIVGGAAVQEGKKMEAWSNNTHALLDVHTTGRSIVEADKLT